MEINTTDFDLEQLYKLTMTSFIPRPISWISTVSPEGVYNLAPYALTTWISTRPMMLLFNANKPSDTWRNATEQGSFVVNIARRVDQPKVALTSQPFAPEVDEFAEAGLTAVPSVTVAAPRLASSPISFEFETIAQHNYGGSRQVIGQLTYLHISDEVLAADGLIDAAKLDPLAKLGRTEWSALDIL